MYENYPINLELNIRSDEELNQQINAVSILNNLDISSTLFSNIISNLHNGQRQQPNSWNNKTLEEWIALFALPYTLITIEAEPLRAIFEYLIQYHYGVISFEHNTNSYRLRCRRVEYNDDYFLENIILKTLEN